MADATSRDEGGRSSMFDRLIGALPAQYRQEVTRVANRIRDSLPPVVIEHRLDALERHVDERLSAMELKLEQILGRLEKR